MPSGRVLGVAIDSVSCPPLARQKVTQERGKAG